LAKQLLNADNFEEALTVIEDELLRTIAEIRVLGMGLGLGSSFENTNNTNNMGNTTSTTNKTVADLETEVELHEALAPLHYLYGTTLLYSLEEAKDDGNDNGAMMTEVGAAAATTVAASMESAAEGASASSPDPTNPWAHLSEPASATGSAAAVPEANNNNANDNSNAEDIQIAWENLEAARTIVEKMLLQQATTTSSSAMSETEVAKLQLDLAQIHLREGDLQRINGNYTSAVGDYSSCLEILLRNNHTKNCPRDLDRKIADTQFNLGLTYLTSSSDLQKEVAGANDNANNDASSGGAAPSATTNADQKKKAMLLAREHCQKGIQQHVDCARTFCVIVARFCGVDPDTIVLQTKTNDNDGTNQDEDAKKPAAGFKTTGLDDNEGDANNKVGASSGAADASQTLNVWRKALSTMVVSYPPSDAENALRVSDILQVLDEIQETIDEAERSQEGVFQAAQIRVKAQQDAAAGDGGASGTEVANADGSTTTIGFGQGASSTAAAAVTATTASKPAASLDAKPMMMVKKKKKRKDAGDKDSDANKRAKTT